MAGNGTWRTNTARDDHGGIILAVDFDVTGRIEARFSDLAASLGPGYAIWETVPPPADAARTGADYIDHWAALPEESGLPVQALFGFCAGAVYAAGLAERMTRVQGTQPLLVLFDPELSVPRTLLWQFLKIVGFMSGTISPADATALRDAGQRAYDEHPKIGDLRDALVQLLRERGGKAFEQAGLDRRLSGELLGIIDSCLHYLAAASDIDPREQWKSAVAFGSSSPMSGLRGMRAAGVDIPVAREIDVTADHGTLLGDRQVAATVRGLLNG